MSDQPDVNMGDPHTRLHELVAAAMITLLQLQEAAAMITLLRLQEPVGEVPSSRNALLELAAAATKEVPRTATKEVPRAAAKKVQPTTSKKIAKKRVGKGTKWCQYHHGDNILEGATVSCKWIAKNGRPIEKPFTAVVLKVYPEWMTVSYPAQHGQLPEVRHHTFCDFETRNGHILVERS
jgi:hypothetical protein